MGFRIPILTYHSIDDSGSVISISPDKFRSQMYHLRDKNYTVFSLQDIVRSLQKKILLPPRSIAITFDDGLKNFYEVAYPILRNMGFTATVFLVPGYCGKDNKWNGQPREIPTMDLLDWEEITEMADNGIDFGAHTVNHTDLSKLSLEQASEEILNSKLMIETHIKKKVYFFSYPYGRLTNDIKAVIKKEFSGACSVELNFVNLESDIYKLPRIDMYYFSKNDFFKYIDTQIFSVYFSFRRFLRSMRNKVNVFTKLEQKHKH